jgi:hypothetical protein
MDFTTFDLMPEWLFTVLGWVPAVIFPTASGLQLLAILHRRSAQGVSIPAWGLFAVANLCLFVYTEKYDEVESIVGALGTSVLNVCIVIAALKFRAHTKTANVTTPSACLGVTRHRKGRTTHPGRTGRSSDSTSCGAGLDGPAHGAARLRPEDRLHRGAGGHSPTSDPCGRAAA